MKRILINMLSFLLVLSLCACGNSKKTEKFCSNCGKGISKEVAFCENCGASVSDANAQSKDSIIDNTSMDNTSIDNTSSVESKSEETSKPAEESKPTQTSKLAATHTHSYSKKVTASTCTAQGYTTYTCSCGESYKDNYTNAAHEYVNYKCAKCGQMDKDNLFSYLKSYVLQKGNPNGEYIIYPFMIDYLGNNLTRTIMLAYCATNESLYFCNCQQITEDFDFITYLYIPKEYSTMYEYSGNLFNTVESNTPIYCTGKISAKDFTKNTPIPCSYFSGNEEYRLTIMDSTRDGLNYLIECIDTFHTEYETGYTLNDMGFNSFK